MIETTEAKIDKLIVHKVGNKVRDEGFINSEELIDVNSVNEQILLNYFLKPFIGIDEIYRFSNPNDLDLNDVYCFSKKIFNSNRNFIKNSNSIAIHLYENSIHPKVTEGDLFIVQFKNIKLGNDYIDTIGIFKSERKDTFLKTSYKRNLAHLKTESGINIKQIDKGCLILNSEEEDGYRVLSIDTNGYDTQYWTERFLGIENAQTSSYNTKAYLKMCKDFGTDFIEKNYDKKEKFIFLSKSMDYFKNNEVFDYDNFSMQVIENHIIKNEFDSFKNTYNEGHGFQEVKEFDISKPALKLIKRQFRNYIRLDTDIELRINDKNVEKSSGFIENGYDEEKGMYYYKVFYNRELN